jgi:hypothetical protein
MLADTAVLTLTNNGLKKAVLLLLNSETFGMLSGNGEAGFSAGTSTTIGSANESGAFSGTIGRFTGSVTKNGTGTWDLTGANILSGGGNGPTINVNDGIVKVGGDLSAVIAMVNSGGTLMGTGSLDSGFINSGGTLAIGNSPGCLTFSSLTLASGANYNQDITGTAACTGYDKATVTGAVDLAGATLNIAQLAGFSPAAGTVLTIVDGASVTGTFAGLANGAVFAVNGVNYRINYTATGEVTLTVVAASVRPTATTPSTTTTLASTGNNAGVITLVSLALVSGAALTVATNRTRLARAWQRVRR